MNPAAYERFFSDNGLTPSESVKGGMLKLIHAPFNKLNNTPVSIKTTGGFIRSQTTMKRSGGGGTVLPMEYFGNTSGNYQTDVSTPNYADASPNETRMAIPKTFKGGANKSKANYNFVSVGGMKENFDPKANKESTRKVNKLLENVYSKAITNGKITVNSLKNAFNKS